MRLQLAEANARIAELTAEVGGLAKLVALGNERISELLAIAQRKKRNPKEGQAGTKKASKRGPRSGSTGAISC